MLREARPVCNYRIRAKHISFFFQISNQRASTIFTSRGFSFPRFPPCLLNTMPIKLKPASFVHIRTPYVRFHGVDVGQSVVGRNGHQARSPHRFSWPPRLSPFHIVLPSSSIRDHIFKTRTLSTNLRHVLSNSIHSMGLGGWYPELSFFSQFLTGSGVPYISFHRSMRTNWGMRLGWRGTWMEGGVIATPGVQGKSS